MTAFASLDAFVAALKAPRAYASSWKLNGSALTGEGFGSWWLDQGGANPGGNVAPTSATTGALVPNIVETGGELFLGAIDLQVTRKDLRWCLLLIDRLVTTSGLSGTVTTAQTTNLPTTPLTRSVGGGGVCAAAEIYTSVGTTQSVASVSYTNQAGVAGQTSDGWRIGSTLAARSVARGFMPISLAQGDTGVRSVESLTLTPSTGTAGDFGITLYRPLCMVYGFGDGTAGGRGQFCPLLGSSGGAMPKIDSNACLQWVVVACGNNVGSTTVIGQSLRLVRQ